MTGCPNIKTPVGAYVSRDGDNAVVRCNVTQETWYITCDGQKWIGDLGNCTGSEYNPGMQALIFCLIVASISPKIRNTEEAV